MHNSLPFPLWKQAPFLRLLIPLVAGILLQWYLQFPPLILITGMLGFVVAFLLFLLFPLQKKFRYRSLQGFIINGLILSLGLSITWQNDMRKDTAWFGNYYNNRVWLAIRINEPLVEKPKSYKADGLVEFLNNDDSLITCRGKVLLYFAKDSAAQKLKYGDIILVSKKLQRIQNSGNPGAFNYEQYASFQGIFHNVYLKENDWVQLKMRKVNSFQQFIFKARDHILSILRKNVGTNKDELGIAQALLIGYTNDLDKDLVQAYSNTGVVHIIAISGMHLGLIYVLLVWLFSRIPLLNRSKLLQVIFILACLWTFSLLTGASASVVRAAVMFTFITIGKSFDKQSSIFNSLAGSAFIMLCYNPYFVWDVGFQLSYLAVMGIVVFQKPVYNWFYIKNKWLDKVWKLAAISFSAQVLTFPVCIYYFHQFPNLFLLTNIIAVPLSSLILYTEIALIALGEIPVAGFYIGKLVSFLVGSMNAIIRWFNQFSFAVWDNIQSTVLSTWILYATVIGICAWLLQKNKKYFQFALFSLLLFVAVNAFVSWQIKNQQQLIVYNVPQHKAIDFVKGNNYRFIGDSILLTDGVLQNFHLKPGRISLQLRQKTDTPAALLTNHSLYQLGGKRILLVDRPIDFAPINPKMDLDIIVISRNPKVSIAQLDAIFNCKLYVFDASNNMWKIDKWQKDCEELHLRSHSVPLNGAFVFPIE